MELKKQTSSAVRQAGMRHSNHGSQKLSDSTMRLQHFQIALGRDPEFPGDMVQHQSDVSVHRPSCTTTWRLTRSESDRPLAARCYNSVTPWTFDQLWIKDLDHSVTSRWAMKWQLFCSHAPEQLRHGAVEEKAAKRVVVRDIQRTAASFRHEGAAKTLEEITEQDWPDAEIWTVMESD